MNEMIICDVFINFIIGILFYGYFNFGENKYYICCKYLHEYFLDHWDNKHAPTIDELIEKKDKIQAIKEEIKKMELEREEVTILAIASKTGQVSNKYNRYNRINRNRISRISIQIK